MKKFLVMAIFICLPIAITHTMNQPAEALINATRRGDLTRVQALLAAGADVNRRDEDSLTALMHAVGRGYLEIVKVLLKHPKINVNACSNFGRTALMSAAFNGHTAIVNVLLAQPDIDINTQDNQFWTALMYAAFKGHAEIANALIKRYAYVNIRDSTSRTALSLATPDSDMARLLRAHGAVT